VRPLDVLDVVQIATRNHGDLAALPSISVPSARPGSIRPGSRQGRAVQHQTIHMMTAAARAFDLGDGFGSSGCSASSIKGTRAMISLSTLLIIHSLTQHSKNIYSFGFARNLFATGSQMRYAMERSIDLFWNQSMRQQNKWKNRP